MKPVVASRNVICFLRPIHVSRRNDKLPVRQLLEKVSANQSPDFIVGSGIQGSPIGFFNPVIPTFTFIGVPFFIIRVPRFFVAVRYPKTFRRCYEEFRLTRTQEYKGTLSSLLKKGNSEKVDHPHRLFFSLFGSVLFK